MFGLHVTGDTLSPHLTTNSEENFVSQNEDGTYCGPQHIRNEEWKQGTLLLSLQRGNKKIGS